MRTINLLVFLLRDIDEINAQAMQFSAKITAGTLNASDCHNGIRTNAFERWATHARYYWDLTDASVDVTAEDYGFPVAKLKSWGIDTAQGQALPASVRNRTKIINLWKAHQGDGSLNPTALLGDLRASMNTARNFVKTNYPVGGSGEDLGITIVDDVRVSANLTTQMVGLKALLDDVSVKCVALNS